MRVSKILPVFRRARTQPSCFQQHGYTFLQIAHAAKHYCQLEAEFGIHRVGFSCFFRNLYSLLQIIARDKRANQLQMAHPCDGRFAFMANGNHDGPAEIIPGHAKRLLPRRTRIARPAQRVQDPGPGQVIIGLVRLRGNRRALGLLGRLPVATRCEDVRQKAVQGGRVQPAMRAFERRHAQAVLVRIRPHRSHDTAEPQQRQRLARGGLRLVEAPQAKQNLAQPTVHDLVPGPPRRAAPKRLGGGLALAGQVLCLSQ